MTAHGMRIFLSYRRGPQNDHIAGRIYDQLRQRFGADAVFLDIESILPGDDFTVRLQDAVGTAQVLLALIGRDWARAGDLRDPRDFVRVEVETALARGITVIPILIDGARLPVKSSLPPSLRPLLMRQALAFDAPTHFRSQMTLLIGQLELRCGVPRQDARADLAVAPAAVPEAEPDLTPVEPKDRQRASSAPLLPVYTSSQTDASIDAVRRASTGFLFETEPPGAAVIVGGWLRGRTPLRVVNLQEGPHSVRVERYGYHTVHRELVAKAGSVIAVPHEQLRPCPLPAPYQLNARGVPRLRVLLVDDDDTAPTLAAALGDAPYDVVTAYDGVGALMILEREDIHVIVSDEWMPGIRGIDLLTTAAREYPHAARIILTGDPNLDEAARAVQDQRILLFLPKPCSSLVLDQVIRETLAGQTRGDLRRTMLRRSDAGLATLERIVEAQSPHRDPPLPLSLLPLTQAEREVVEALLVHGTAGAVAHALLVSLSTVRARLRSSFPKLGVRSQLELFNRLAAESASG
jgi:DNA-binding NarL/FixJ family response regulator